MGIDFMLDLHGRDVLAATTDCILCAIDEIKIALCVLHQHVASMEPEIAPGIYSPIGAVPVPSHHNPRQFWTNYSLARHADGHFAVVLVDDPHLVEALLDAAASPVVGKRKTGSSRAVHLGAAPGRRHQTPKAL